MVTGDSDNNGWDKYQLYITTELKRQAEMQKEILEKVNDFNTRISLQESKIKWIATGASVVVSALVNIFLVLIKR